VPLAQDLSIQFEGLAEHGLCLRVLVLVRQDPGEQDDQFYGFGVLSAEHLAVFFQSLARQRFRLVMPLLCGAWSIVRYHHDVFGNIVLII
jgi:hypothetical protein